MYPGKHARLQPDQPAVIMAGSGEVLTYGQLERRSNRLAHLFRALGLQRLDHYAVFMENNARYVEVCAAGERAGFYFTCINSYLMPDEVAYIVNNSESKILITSEAKRAVAMAALRQCPNVRLCLIVDGEGDGPAVRNVDQTTAEFSDTPITDEALGVAMLYSSGTTGRPKGIVRPLPDVPPSQKLPVYDALMKLWRFRDGVTYLSPAPLYHSAPLAGVAFAIHSGGTAIVMEHFDAEQFLRLVEQHRVTHTQLVPTMFSRLLKLPEEARTRYDLSSLEVAFHGAAPCPVQVKQQMIGWWGPIILEYYGMTEGIGFTICDSAEWLAHKGTVGRPLFGQLHILDDAMKPVPPGTVGVVWFRLGSEFEYFNDKSRTAESLSSDRTMGTVGDVGYVDGDGYLYLTDRATFMIISGGVNIYPQECENLLITHPKVADAAVFGIPNADLGEEVKAVVQPMPEVRPDDELAEELIAFCREHLAHMKCPRSIDFAAELPRLPTGKLYKRELRDRYWAGHRSRIV